MIEFISQSPMPTTLVTAGLTALMFMGGSGTTAKAAPQKVEQGGPTQASVKSAKSFSFFDQRQKFKEMPVEFADAYREMFSFKGLKRGWDGVGSDDVSNTAVDTALAFLNLIPPDTLAPDASVSADGTVDWYWRNGDHSGIVTFHKNGKVAYFVRSGGLVAKDTFELSDTIPADLVSSLQRL